MTQMMLARGPFRRALWPVHSITTCAASTNTNSNAYESAESTRRTNWLELNCGDVPIQARPQDLEVSEMLRGGHAVQVASAAMLNASLQSATGRSTTASYETHIQMLKELKEVEDKGVERLVDAVATGGFRFRPSATLPLAYGSSYALGSCLSLVGETVRTSYFTGVKSAIAEYYNDQIREIYAEKPDEVELKDIFKVARDEELVFVDARTPDALDAAKYDEDPVRSFARNSTKVLLQVSTQI